MIKHIVMWRLKEEAEGRKAADNAAELKRRLEGLVGRISEIRELEVGININTESPAAFDVVLYSAFSSPANLAAYAAHPDHQDLLGFVRAIVSDRCVVDYEV